MSFLSAARRHFAGRVILFLSATTLQALLAVAILPLVTLKLTATDFGYFALLMSFVAFVNALGDGGGALALPAHYGVQSGVERRRMIASFFMVSLTLSFGLAVLSLLVWPWAVSYVLMDGGSHSELVSVLTAMMIPLRSVTTLATIVFSVGGRGTAIAGQIAAQAIGTFFGTLVFLFYLDLGAASLFAGAISGQCASFAAAAFALGAQPWTWPSARWLAVAARNAPTAAFAGTIDGLRGLGENVVVAGNVAVAAVGYYNHARLYFALLLGGTNAVAHNVWSTSLAEARDEGSSFPRTTAAWSIVYAGLALFGIGTAFFGVELVSGLTNDQLTPAAPLLPWFAVLLLIHVSGRPQNAVAFANGAGARVSQIRAVLSLLALATLPFLVGEVVGYGMSLGIAGVLVALLLEAIAFRLCLLWVAKTYRRQTSFHDQWVVAGIVLTIVAWQLNALLSMGLSARVAIVTTVVFGVIAFERRRLLRLWTMLRSL